jgi:enoyl-CoA hydratase
MSPRTPPATPPNAEDTDVLVRKDNALGRITLNRPKAINALSLEMVRQIQVGLDAFEDDPSIEIVLLDGAGDRGFCAGGDIVALQQSAKDGTDDARVFWSEEYALNARIANFEKPVVAIMDGVVMGGGIGLAGHASHRLATERLVSAMPEVGIGFSPDVGGTWLLSRQDGELGTHLALTGARIGARDAIAAGLADRIVASSAVEELVAELASGDLEGAIDTAEEVEVEIPDGNLVQSRRWIAEAYAHDTAEEIIAGLQRTGEKAAKVSALGILSKSPTSVKVALRGLREARDMESLEDALRQELRISCAFLSHPDFVEGVRAQVIDKDRKPQWSPKRLQEVDDAAVDRFIAPLGEPDLDLDTDGARRT